MCMIEGLSGKSWRILNLVVRGMGEVLMSTMGSMGWDYGRILRGVGRSFLVIPNLRWEMAPSLDSSNGSMVRF